MINMYYMDHGLYVFRPDHIRADYEDMKDMGCDAVTLSVLEQFHHGHKAIQNHCRLAHAAGLKIHVIPARFGGMFAGAPKTASGFAINNPDLLVEDANGDRHGVCCVENPGVRDFFAERLQSLIGDYEFDGVVLDEPKGTDIVCHCRHCCEAYGKVSHRTRQQSIVNFLGFLCDQIKSVRDSVEISLFAMPHDSGEFLAQLAALPNLDYIGIDGPVCDQETAPGAPIVKASLFESAPAALVTASEHGKKSLLVLESFGVPAWAYDAFAAGLDRALAYSPDQWIFFYYPHNTEDPDRLMALTESAIRRISGRSGFEAG